MKPFLHIGIPSILEHIYILFDRYDESSDDESHPMVGGFQAEIFDSFL